MFHKITMLDYTRPLPERKAARRFTGPYYWRAVDRTLPSGRNRPCNGRVFYQSSDGLLMDRHGSTLALRIELAGAHYSSRVIAFWGDDYGDTTFTPIVARLPNNRGFLAGWTMGAGMLASLDGTIWSDIESAASAAFDDAERAAERERRYSEEA